MDQNGLSRQGETASVYHTRQFDHDCLAERGRLDGKKGSFDSDYSFFILSIEDRVAWAIKWT